MGQPLSIPVDKRARRLGTPCERTHLVNGIEYFLDCLWVEDEHPDTQRPQTEYQFLGVSLRGQHQFRVEGDDFFKAHGREVADFLDLQSFGGIVAVIRHPDDRTSRPDSEKQFGVAGDKGHDSLRGATHGKRGPGVVRHARLTRNSLGNQEETEEQY